MILRFLERRREAQASPSPAEREPVVNDPQALMAAMRARFGG